MSKKKKVIIGVVIAAVVVVAIVAVVLFVLFGSSKGNTNSSVYAEKVSDIMYSGNSGINRYSGLVEAENTLELKKDDSKTVKDILVKVGDSVDVGTELFTYDVEEIKNQQLSASLELEGLQNELSGYDSQIKELTNEKKSAPSDQQLDYTLKIQELQTQQKQCQYNITAKQAEIKKYDDSIANATVTSTITGTVKSINDSDNSDSNVFMTIVATGKYRVKGTIDEQSFYNAGMSEGMDVIIRSRVDENQTWKGTITKFDTENPESNNNNGYYSDDSNTETASKYPFYIELADASGLMMGQHVYIEPDYGQGEAKEGIWIAESYFVMDGDSTYVWALNGKDRLEKREVELGDYDADLMMYEVKSGLSEDDYIVWNDDSLEEGQKVTKFEDVDWDEFYSNSDDSDGDIDDGSLGYDTEFVEPVTDEDSTVDYVDDGDGSADSGNEGAADNEEGAE